MTHHTDGRDSTKPTIGLCSPSAGFVYRHAVFEDSKSSWSPFERSNLGARWMRDRDHDLHLDLFHRMLRDSFVAAMSEGDVQTELEF